MIATGQPRGYGGPEAKYFENYCIEKNCCKSYLNAKKIKLQRMNERQEFGGEDIRQYFIHQLISSTVLQLRRRNFGSKKWTFSKNVLISHHSSVS